MLPAPARVAPVTTTAFSLAVWRVITVAIVRRGLVIRILSVPMLPRWSVLVTWIGEVRRWFENVAYTALLGAGMCLEWISVDTCDYWRDCTTTAVAILARAQRRLRCFDLVSRAFYDVLVSFEYLLCSDITAIVKEC